MNSTFLLKILLIKRILGNLEKWKLIFHVYKLISL